MYRIVTGIILLVVLGSGCKPSTAHSFSLEDELCQILQTIEKDHPMERDSITGKVFLSKKISFAVGSGNSYFLEPYEDYVICDSTYTFISDSLNRIYGCYFFYFFEPKKAELGLIVDYVCINQPFPTYMCNDYGKAILFKKKKVWEIEKVTYLPFDSIEKELEYE